VLRALEAETSPAVYLPLLQVPYPFLSIVVRTSGEPTRLASALRRELRAVEPTRALSNVRSLPEVLGTSLAQRRFTATVVGTCVLAALILAIIGLYGGISSWWGSGGARWACGWRSVCDPPTPSA